MTKVVNSGLRVNLVTWVNLVSKLRMIHSILVKISNRLCVFL